MNFKVCNHGSKYSYLLHKMGFADSQFGTTVHTGGANQNSQSQTLKMKEFSEMNEK